MSYKNIPRKCSVCECCGSCDYEYEVENDCVSGDFSPLIGAIRQETGLKPEELIKAIIKEDQKTPDYVIGKTFKEFAKFQR